MSKVKRAYAAFGRGVHKAVTPFLRLYMNERHVRVRVLIINEEKEVLLVRSWLGRQLWSMPGGGIKSTETPAEAAVREVREETGLRLVADQLQELGVFPNETNQKYTYTTACYGIQVAKREPKLKKGRKLEMLGAAWFPIAKLPPDVSPSVLTALKLQAS